MDSNHRFGIANREAISTALLWALLLWAGLLPTRAQTPQSLSWTEPMDGTILLLGKGYPLTATASSGLPVTFKVTGGPAEIRVGQLIVTNLGRITVQAEQAGTSTFARVAVERSFNEPSPVLEKQFASPGKVRATQYGLAVSGKRLYVAQEIAGLRILDVTDPEKPVTLGVRATEGIASVSVAVAGNTVFISDDIGLRALDVSDPANIKDLAYTTELGGQLDFDVEGNRLVTWDPLRIVDVSDPRNFKLVGSVEEYGRGDIEKGLAYISDWYAARLRVIDFRNPSDIRELGAVDNVSVGLIHEVAVSGSIAHVVGDLGYAMIDVGTPSRPRELAFFRMPNPCFEVGVHGTKVVVTDGANTVHVLETANRASIKEVWSGRAGPWWTSVPLPISDGKAYLQGINGSVVVLDLNSAGGARVLSEFTFGGWAFGIDLFGGRPWLADEFGGLKVFDPDLSNPVEHHFGFEVNPQGLDRFGDRAVVVGGGLEDGARLDVLSVSNGLPGQIVGTWKAAMGPGNVQSVLLENDRAYVVGDGLHVYDLLDPRNPKWLGEVPAPHANPNALRPVPNWNLQSVGGSVFFGNIGGIFKVDGLSPTQPPRLVLGKPLEVGTLPFRIRDGFLYCVSSGRLEVWDIHDLGAPNLLGSLEIDIYWVDQLVLDKNTAYLRGAEQIVAVDISSPATPKVRSTFRPSSGVSSIAVEDGIFYAYGPQGLEIFDVQNPATPESLALWENETNAQQIQVRNRVAFLASYTDLKVLDVSDPQNIRTLPGYDTAGDVLGVDVLGDRVALGAGVMGLVLLERTPGGVMTRIGNAPSSDAARRVRIRDNLAYVACRKSGLRIISLETPEKPVELGNVDTLSDAVDIWVEDKLAYVATYGTGLQIFDVSNPSSPMAVGAFPGTGLTLSVRVAGGKAYVASEDVGVVILDVSNPAKVFKLGEFNTGVAGDNSLCLEKDGDIVVTAGNQRLSVLDVSQPSQPVLLGSADLYRPGKSGSRSTQIRIEGDRVYLARMNLGAEVWRLRRDVRLLQALSKLLPRTLRMEDGSFTLPLELNSGLMPSYRIVSGPAHIEGGRLIPHGLGSVVIEVTAPGNVQFQPFGEQYTLQIEAVPELRWRISSASPSTLIFDSAPQGYVLQRASALSPADWKTLSEVFPAEVSLTDAIGFFRLFQGP